jgi:hypothetical protein
MKQFIEMKSVVCITLYLSVMVTLLMQSATATEDIHGRVAITGMGHHAKSRSLDAALGEQDRFDVLGDFRLTWEPHWQSFSVGAAYQLFGDLGPGTKLANSESMVSPSQSTTLLDLDHTFVRRNDLSIAHRIDRLSIGYATPQTVVRLGRQALTWGGGFVFHPMDLIDPFAPAAIDTEYKPGVDMGYLQRLFSNGSDLQWVVVPRAAKIHGGIDQRSSTAAMHYHLPIGTLSVNTLLAHDYGDWVAGIGINGGWKGSAWNIEVVPSMDANHEFKNTWLANISYGLLVGHRNAMVFGEVFHNGFGAEADTPLGSLPDNLQKRIARGQLFTVSRNYFAFGGNIDWTPLVAVSVTSIVNLDDRSFYIAAECNDSLSDNANIYFGLQLPIGNVGTEYGGLAVANRSEPYVAPATAVYVQVRQHF